MHFTVKLKHRSKRYSYKVTMEPDLIFIAYTLTRKGRVATKIFLTKVDKEWSSDFNHPALIKKLTTAIDCKLKEMELDSEDVLAIF